MTHHLRKKLQSDLKHALFYTGRVFMQTVSNFWETSKGQQLITLTILALISVFINIYFGLITIGNASTNIQSVLSICGVLLLLFLLVNFVRAPFQLDREREETINELRTHIYAPEKQAGITINQIVEKPKHPDLEPNIICVGAYVSGIARETITYFSAK